MHKSAAASAATKTRRCDFEQPEEKSGADKVYKRGHTTAVL